MGLLLRFLLWVMQRSKQSEGTTHLCSFRCWTVRGHELCIKRAYFSIDEKAKNEQLSLFGCNVDIYSSDVLSEEKWIPADETGRKQRFYRREEWGTWQKQVDPFIYLEIRHEKKKETAKMLLHLVFFKEISKILCGERIRGRKYLGTLRDKSRTSKSSSVLTPPVNNAYSCFSEF